MNTKVVYIRPMETIPEEDHVFYVQELESFIYTADMVLGDKTCLYGTPLPSPAEDQDRTTTTQQSREEIEQEPTEIIRAEDKQEDDRENLPSIGNIKSRFEHRQEQEVQQEEDLERSSRGHVQTTTTTVTRTTRQWETSGDDSERMNGHVVHEESEQREETQAEEEPQEEVVSLRSKYEQRAQATSPEVTSPTTKKPSKWDKPKEPPPPPVNRREEEEAEITFTEVREEELPPSAITRNLVSRFRSIESGEYEQQEAERKPVRKMTPPRDEIEGSIQEYRKSQETQEVVRDPNVVVSGQPSKDEEEELPPPAFAKTMLAKFKSMEDVNAPPPSPLRASTTTTTTRRTETTTVRQVTRSSPDSGISVSGEGQMAASEPAPSIRHEEVVEGGVFENQPVVKEGVVREQDGPSEEELPERGFTKSLLAQWRNVESKSSSVPEPAPITSPTKRTKSWSYQQSPGAVTVTQSTTISSVSYTETDGQGEGEQPMERPRDVVRESDQNEEEFLPPPAFTKNMLAKFQNLEAQNRDVEVTSPVPASKREMENKQSFKWQVKEARTLARPGAPTSSELTYTETAELCENGLQVERESVHVDAHADSTEVLEEELPPPAMTKSLLAKFQTIQDPNGPPPSPQRSALIQKEAVKSVRTTPARKSQAPVVERMEDEEGQGEGLDEEEYGQYEREVIRHDQFMGAPESGEFENEPQYNDSVIRESDRNDEEELPEQGTTRNLLAKFQSMQNSH